MQDASDVVARDDDADEDEPSNDEADPEEESKSSGDEVKETEKMVDADLIQMKTLRSTTSIYTTTGSI